MNTTKPGHDKAKASYNSCSPRPNYKELPVKSNSIDKKFKFVPQCN